MQIDINIDAQVLTLLDEQGRLIMPQDQTAVAREFIWR